MALALLDCKVFARADWHKLLMLAARVPHTPPPQNINLLPWSHRQRATGPAMDKDVNEAKYCRLPKPSDQTNRFWHFNGPRCDNQLKKLAFDASQMPRSPPIVLSQPESGRLWGLGLSHSIRVGATRRQVRLPPVSTCCLSNTSTLVGCLLHCRHIDKLALTVQLGRQRHTP